MIPACRSRGCRWRSWVPGPSGCSVTEVVSALPFGFEHDDHVQILTDMAGHLGPALGGAPTA